MDISDLITPFLVILLWGGLLYILSIRFRDNGLADLGWGPGFILLSWGAVLWPLHWAQGLLLMAVTLWGLRLFLRLFLRRKILKGEDRRYRQWREEWGKLFYLRSYFQIYLLQPLLLFLNAIPLLFFFSAPFSCFSPVMLIGVLLWPFGFCYEAIADWQLDRFHQQRKLGLVQTSFCQDGLWQYSRHPNYFGEVVLWWGIYFYCAPTIGYLVAAIGPVTITFLILFVSGIPMAESRRAQDPSYQRYQETTNAFWPKYFRRTI